MADEHREPEGIGGGEHQRTTMPLWFVLLAVAVGLWAAYYVIKYWGGLGPGIGY